MAPALKYGLLAAGGMSAWLLAEYVLGLHGSRIALGQYTHWLTELGLIFALWRLHTHQLRAGNRYWLPLWEALAQGLLACLVAAAGVYIYLSLYLNFINPFYPDNYLEWEVARLRAAGETESQIQDMVRGFRWSMGPVGLPLSIIGLYLLIGLVASPVITLWFNWRHKETTHVG